ncbi:MAG: hypothetical protein ACTHLW_14525 [Verrucomicrobiota bacterium]
MRNAPFTNYVYHLYGNDEIFLKEASYSISTLFRRIDPKTSRIVLFTDHPERATSLPVTCVSIADEIPAMRGQSNYCYRVKLCCILKCTQEFPGNVVYLDCDTIVARSPESLAARLQPGQGLMYLREKLQGRFHQFEGFQMRLPDGRQYRYDADSWMFNAGVVGFHSQNAGVINDALRICDELLSQKRLNHVCEQFAVSEAFRLAGINLLESHPVITHYYRSSAKRYMHHRLARVKQKPGEHWNLNQRIAYSYPRVQLFKWFKVS